MDGRHRVVVVGAGFGGLFATKALRRAPVDVTLINGTTHHLFQPLLYQVTTGILSEGEIAPPILEVLRRQRNTRVLLGTVTDVDVEAREVRVVAPGTTYTVGYDSLIVAAGSAQSYFGNDRFAEFAPGMKSIDDALELRGRIFTAFELAELESDPAAIERWLTFVVVGAGPTGVEMAGQIAEIARGVRNDFHSIEPAKARILLVEAADRVLGGFPPSLSAKGQRSLERLGVTVLVGQAVVDLDHDAVTVKAADAEPERIPARTVVWAAGVVGSELAGMLAARAGHETDRAGRVEVLGDLSLPDHPEVLAIGDMIRIRRAEGEPLILPGLAPVAMQQGRHAARVVRDRLRGGQARPFHYRDKGNLATIGRAAAVADIKGLKLSGFVAWVTWLLVHLWYLIGFQNRVLVLIRWAFSFFMRGTRGARLITYQGAMPSESSSASD